MKEIEKINIPKKKTNQERMYNDDDMISFSEWINSNFIKDDTGWCPNYKDDWFTTKEILEQFKKK